ncbi:alpha-keto acid decarboxylase family protein [Rothia sp. SD9660Na]|uniref:alpha-keto acid decarboxylase family protein n=1 Tax=Rothia sp. SD9660Na TaxID=3047030 RepID=UPI0024B9DC33|nr:alpha-keto acid decarboxylase family protein [Rothia sp. SD9660Na]WHS50467.1 alpha-keto acid decarboxylase family protein [Rothia sp. SD9660Na]
MTYTVGNYILDRLAELGVDKVFGVPGDFNLFFLDDVLAHEKLDWVGNANELNAGYAADGYARVKGLGALVTTYGVGELSAINATAGSYAENVPVIHIVGAPSLSAQNSHLRMHHTLGDGDFKHFMRMASEVSAAVAALHPATAATDIDRVIRTAVIHRKPGYLMLPVDVSTMPATPPSRPLDVDSHVSSPDIEALFKDAITDFMRGKSVTVLADIMAERLGAVQDVRALVTETKFPFASLMWGKAVLNETKPNFAGIYVGGLSAEHTRAVVEDAEVLVCAGVEFTDTTTGIYSHQIDFGRVINIGTESTSVAGRHYAPLTMASALNIVKEVSLELGLKGTPFEAPTSEEPLPDITDEALTQDVLWRVLSSNLDEKNTVVVDMGTSFFGMATRKFPRDSRFIGMPLWGSIGYSIPALLGAAMADTDSRGVLMVGDGSAQLTIQEIGTIIREGVNPVVFLINNDGYTIERSIHGVEAEYNDITAYDWSKIPAAFGGTDSNTVTLRAATVREFDEACRVAKENRDKLVFVEVVTAPMDMPELLEKFGAQAAQLNKKK